ncbi:MAG: cytochrome c oxidase subunit 3 [Ignavibacteria bacterium]|nr:cytochrome c oxidase subunit 3 [Ignavibacteria bacterium]
MNALTSNYKNIFYPPGGILVLMIVMLELTTFGMALIGLTYYSTLEPELFHTSRLHLNPAIGAINTVVLLLSGYFMAMAVHSFKKQEIQKTSKFMKLALLGGGVFLLIKSLEYYTKIEAGLTLDKNLFFTFYWLLTGFHLLHVLVGIVILFVIHRNMMKKNVQTPLEDVEAGAAFWHMCDLIWLLLFPSLYLIL